jgi:hypothetical protein
VRAALLPLLPYLPPSVTQNVCRKAVKAVWGGAYVEAALTGVAPATDDSLCDHLE